MSTIEVIEESTNWVTILVSNVSSLDAVLILYVMGIVYLSKSATKSNTELYSKSIDTIKRLAYCTMGIRVLMPIVEKLLSLI